MCSIGGMRKMCGMKRYFIISVCSILCATIILSVSADDVITVRVGIYENSPKIFTDNEGNALGFWPDILEYIAVEEGWEIEWIPGTWAQCLERLEKNEIDIMPDVAYTEERSKKYDFSDEAVLVSWSRVYAKESDDIQCILDLEGKNIAVLEGSVNVEGPNGIKELIQKFDIDCIFTEMDSYTKVFELVESKKADAGVTNKDFGNKNEKEYNVERTPIIFQPLHIQFAFTKNSSLSPYLIERIDYHTKELKEDGSSIYYRSLEKWLEVKPAEMSVIPWWMKWVLTGIVGIVILLAGGNFILKSRVESRTKELREEISERKKARKEAEFYADVLAHDIGNLDQITMGYLYLLKNAKDEETRKKNIDGIKKSIMKSKRLTESIKTLKIIKDTKIEKFDLNKSIERSIKNIKEYSDKEIEVNLNIDKKYYVKANDFLDKVFFSIFENSVEFIFKEKVIIDIKTEEKNGFCNIHIHDNGIGISKEKREDIIENLETLSKRTGMGFYLTKKILERFNGKFEIKDVKKGTEIVVSIPVANGRSVRNVHAQRPDERNEWGTVRDEDTNNR